MGSAVRDLLADRSDFSLRSQHSGFEVHDGNNGAYEYETLYAAITKHVNNALAVLREKSRSHSDRPSKG